MALFGKKKSKEEKELEARKNEALVQTGNIQAQAQFDGSPRIPEAPRPKQDPNPMMDELTELGRTSVFGYQEFVHPTTSINIEWAIYVQLRKQTKILEELLSLAKEE